MIRPVRPGTAEQLARIAHFRAIEHVQAEELDFVALWLIGDAGDAVTKHELWNRLRPVCEHLWSFVTDDWDENDCDDMSAQEAALPAGHGWDALADRTRERLATEIEGAIRLARYREAEARRAALARVPA